MGEWFKQNVENSITAKVKMNKLLINMVNFPKPKKKKKNVISDFHFRKILLATLRRMNCQNQKSKLNK